MLNKRKHCISLIFTVALLLTSSCLFALTTNCDILIQEINISHNQCIKDPAVWYANGVKDECRNCINKVTEWLTNCGPDPGKDTDMKLLQRGCIQKIN